MSDLLQNEDIKRYLYEIVWRYHTPANSYDVDGMSAEAVTHFSIAEPQLDAIRELAKEVASAHCRQCGSPLQSQARECFCCGWTLVSE